MQEKQKLLTQKEASEILGISEAWLERDRWQGARIPFVKFSRAVRYKPEDLERFIEENTRRSTSDDR